MTSPLPTSRGRTRQLRSRAFAAVGLLLLAGCTNAEDIPVRDLGDAAESANITDTLAAAPVSENGRHATSIDGFWQTDGYGFALEIRGDALRLWQVTRASCIASYTGHRLEPQPDAKGVAFELDVGIRLRIRSGSSSDRAKMRTEGSVTDWGLERIDALPAVCDRAPPDDPVSVFDAFWATYAENYPFSTGKGVDWNATRTEYRPKVGSQTTPAELFEILSAMIRPLADMHTHIFAGDAGNYDGWRPDTEPYSQALLDRVTQIVEERDVEGPLRTWAGGRVGFADLPNRIGYLRITAFDFGTDDADADAVEMDRVLDQIFSRERVSNQRGLIIDVRVSTGGHNPLGLLVAGRLTRTPYVAYATVARRPDLGDYTPAEWSWVRPAKRAYTGPVVLLTSPYTVSAHEVFTQALMGRKPAVVRVGGNTQGAISDHHFRALPNGWVFTLPNQRFFSAGVAYDGGGVPPAIRVPTITPEEIQLGEDSAFDRAVALLGSRRSWER
jgi:hypothetical protein